MTEETNSVVQPDADYEHNVRAAADLMHAAKAMVASGAAPLDPETIAAMRELQGELHAAEYEVPGVGTLSRMGGRHGS